MIAYYFDGMEIIAIVPQYCEKNLLIKEKKGVRPSKGLLCLYDNKIIHGACRYGIFLLVFNSTSHSSMNIPTRAHDYSLFI